MLIKFYYQLLRARLCQSGTDEEQNSGKLNGKTVQILQNFKLPCGQNRISGENYTTIFSFS